jgi:hypothetical protein
MCVTVFPSCWRDDSNKGSKKVWVQEAVRMKKLGEMQLTKKEKGEKA